jgi:hypothetical protein
MIAIIGGLRPRMIAMNSGPRMIAIIEFVAPRKIAIIESLEVSLSDGNYFLVQCFEEFA